MIDTLTSLRIFFALMVFGAHYYVLDASFDAHVFKEGFVGVSFFFVLSGFIIAYNYQEKLLTKRTTKRTYWYVNPVTRLPDFFVGVLLYQLYRSLCGKKISYSTGTLLEVGVVILFLLFYLCAADIPKVYRYSCYYWLPVSLIILIFALQKGGAIPVIVQPVLNYRWRDQL